MVQIHTIHISLPTGMFSEEALEARNKDYRKFRSSNCRKSSRKNTMEDLAHSLFISSDPCITKLSKGAAKSPKNNEPLDKDVINLLLINSIENYMSHDSVSDSE